MKRMQKGLLAVSALLVSAGAFAQVGIGVTGKAQSSVNTGVVNQAASKAAAASQQAAAKSVSAAQNAAARTSAATQATTHEAGAAVREQSRINGSVHANANANQNAQVRSSENSVLNATGTMHGQNKIEAHDEAKKTGGEVKERTSTTVEESNTHLQEGRERARASRSINAAKNASATGKANADGNSVLNSESATDHQTKIKADNHKIDAKSSTKASNQTTVNPQ